jgi:hypothetical protein
MQKLNIKILLTSTTLFLSFLTSNAQNLRTIEVDPITDMAKESLPFDQGFVLKKIYNEPIAVFGVAIYQLKHKELKNYFDSAQMTEPNLKYKIVQNETKYELFIFVEPLNPQKFYDFLIIQKISKKDMLINKYINFFDSINTNNMDGASEILKNINEIKKKEFDPFEHLDSTFREIDTARLKTYYKVYLKKIYEQKISDSLRQEKIIEQIINSDKFLKGKWISSTSEIFSFETRVKYRVYPDFGYVYYGFKDNFYGVTPYLGFQMELRYLDKNIPFRLIQNRKIWHRLSFNSGITLASLKKDGKREDLFSGKSLLLGMGFRFSNAIRLTGGIILFNREDTNPLIDDKKLAITPFVGISIDLSLKQMFTDFSSLIPINRK